jgi:hypothetical protein
MEVVDTYLLERMITKGDLYNQLLLHILLISFLAELMYPSAHSLEPGILK